MNRKARLIPWLGNIFALLLIVVSLAPFCYVLLHSFFPQEGIFSPQSYYDVLLGQSQYLLRFWKSLLLCAAIVLGQITVSVFAGYGFAKCRFRGRDILFYLLIVLMILPLQVTLVPNYLMLSDLRLLNTYASLILPSIFTPLGTFILRQSFHSISDAVLDAARLDGCGTLRLIARIAVPMNWGGLVCVAILSFLDAWNMVEQPIAYLNDFEQYPLSVALAYAPPAERAVQLVCCVLAILPCLFLFLCFNKELVDGITLAEVK